MLWALAFAAIAAMAVGIATWMVVTRAKQLGDVQDELTLNLRSQVATLEIAAGSTAKDLLTLQKAADDAKAAQQRVETDLAKQQQLTANAERSLLELKERIKPRRLTDQQSTDFVKALKTLPNGAINLGHTAGGGDEGFNLLKQLMPLFKEAGWKTPESTSGTTNHMDIQVIGVGILVPGPPGTDPAKGVPPNSFIQLTPTLTTLRAAFKAVGIDVKFINWYPREDNIPELVIGSKPEP